MSGEPAKVVRVLPDVSGLDKEFDYLVPDRWRDEARLGSLVRIDLHGRRVAGWIVATDVDPAPGITLRELSKISSIGPGGEVLDVARWAAHRWSGRLASILKAASPDTMVEHLPEGPGARRLPEPAGLAADAFNEPGVTVVRVPPSAERMPFVLAAAAFGDGIVVTPGVRDARFLGGQLRRAGGRVALAGRDWALGAAGGTVIGARKAAWSTVRRLEVVLVLEEHDESLQEERNPTWHARDVLIERARRLDAPCVLVSSAPSLVALEAADRVLTASRTDERAGWPIVEVIDRRQAEPGRSGLFSSELAELLRSTTGRVICVLNRKGRSPMMACASCGELVRTEDGQQLMADVGGELVSLSGERRPLICAVCTGTKLKRLRLGVNRAREELQALAGEHVGEVTGETSPEELAGMRVVVGTEAVLHRIHEAEAVVFLDFDQELLAPRYRAAEQAMGLLVRAATIVGPRGTGRIMVQTRTPEHRTLRAAVRADPGLLAAEETEMRRASGFPPFGGLAEVGGAGAAEFTTPLIGRLDVDVLGPRSDGRFLLRADSNEVLSRLLAETPRPKGRLRVAVDPPRV